MNNLTSGEAFLPCPYIEEVSTTPRVKDVLAARSFLESHGQHAVNGQVCLQMPQSMAADDPDRWVSGTGTLYGTGRRAQDYTKILPEAEWVLPLLAYCEQHSGQKAVRTRIMTSQPGRCLSYHKDDEKWRYHVPLVSHTSARFLVADTVGNMPVIGAVYRLRTDLMHTAINASKTEVRTHIVVCMVER